MIKKRLIQLMGDSKKYIAWQVVWQWLALLSTILAMTVTARLIEAALYQAIFHGDILGKRLAPSLAVILPAIFIRFVSARFTAEASVKAGAAVKDKLRCLLYEKLTRLGASYHEKVPTAEAVQVAVEGVEQLEIYYGRYLPQLFYSILAPVTLFLALSFISLRASLVLLICVPLIPLTIMAVQKIAGRLLGRYWGVYTGLGECFLENLQGLTTLKIYEADQFKADEMDRQAEEFRKITMKVLMMQLNSIIVMDVVAYGGAAAGIIAALLEYQAGNVTISGMLSIIFLSAEFFIPMRLLGSFFHIAMNGMAASDKLFKILDLPEGKEGGEELGDGPVSVSFENVGFSYEPSRPVLSGISFSLPGRGMAALCGMSGCGKSTIAGILTGRGKGYTGSVRLNGRELSSIREGSLMRHVTLVSHNSYLFRGTVEDNLRMAAPEASTEALREALRKVRLWDFLEGQKGLATELLERGENLSGGQRQRLALARALLHDTPVYIFDEAASNIDAESEEQIMEVIRELSRERLVILISHRLANVVEADWILMIEKGRLKEMGRHGELMERNGGYAGLYRRQEELEQYGKGAFGGGEAGPGDGADAAGAAAGLSGAAGSAEGAEGALGCDGNGAAGSADGAESGPGDDRNGAGSAGSALRYGRNGAESAGNTLGHDTNGAKCAGSAPGRDTKGFENERGGEGHAQVWD